MIEHRNRLFEETQFEEQDAAVESEDVVARTYGKVVRPDMQHGVAQIIPLGENGANLASEHGKKSD
jgi:hypothetical protein